MGAAVEIEASPSAPIQRKTLSLRAKIMVGLLGAVASAGYMLAVMHYQNVREPLPWVEIGGQRYHVEIAAGQTAQEVGLMFRDNLPKNRGMLFVLPQDQDLNIWMKHMQIPLDVLYFDRNGALVDYHEGVPPCKASPCPIYSSRVQGRYILELNAGEIARMQLTKGERLTLPQHLTR